LRATVYFLALYVIVLTVFLLVEEVFELYAGFTLWKVWIVLGLVIALAGGWLTEKEGYTPRQWLGFLSPAVILFVAPLALVLYLLLMDPLLAVISAVITFVFCVFLWAWIVGDIKFKKDK
jgi:hypothetical protein